MRINALSRIAPHPLHRAVALTLEPFQELLRALRRLGGGEAAVIKAQLKCDLADGFLHGASGVT